MAKPSILVTRPLMDLVMQGLAAQFDLVRWWELDAGAQQDFVDGPGKTLKAVAAISGLKIDGAFMDQFPALEIISNFGVGYDNIDAAAAKARGIIVTNTPDVLTDEVADLTLGLLLSTIRKLPQAERHLKNGAWMKGNFPLTDSLRGKAVGIFGLGRIGLAIAKRVEAFGVSVSYHSRRKVEGVGYAYYDSLAGLAKAVDVLIVIAPATPETRHAVNAEVLAALGPRGTLINVARGSLVDEAALVSALQSGVIAAAGLDVFEVEPCLPAALAAMENVVLLPHVGSASVHTRNLMGQLQLDNITGWMHQRRPKTPVVETPWIG